MLAFARKKLSKWLAIALLGFVLVAMVVTGFGTDGLGGLGSMAPGQSGTTLAEVDGETVSEQELGDVLNRQFNRAREQQPTLDMRTFLSTGAFDQILNQMIVAAALEGFGRDRGLTVSQRMIDREIVNIPAFRNFAGQFDETTFRRALAGQNVTERQLRDDIASSLMQRQLLGPIALGARVPDGVAREYANLLLERRRGAIGVVPAELMAQGIAPTDAEVQAFYAASRDRFAIPERRVIKYALIGPEQIAQAARATDQEIAAHYRQNAATYGPRQTRTLQQIVLQDRAQAQAFAQRVRGGTAFADAASQAGFGASDITFENQNRDQFAEATAAQVAAAAFQAPQGAVAGPIQSELGFHIVRVDQINTVPGRPLEAVRAEIAQTIERRKAADLLADLVARVEERLADGASLEEAAQAERLQIVTTPAITATGQAPGQPWVAPPELQPLLQSAFEIDAEDLEPVVEQIGGSQRFALLGVERVDPAAAPPLPLIRDQVRAALVRQRGLERARSVAQAIVDRINAGMPAAQAFGQAQPRLPAPEAVDLRRLDIARGGQQAPPPLLALFSLPQGRARLLPAPNGAGWFVVHHGQRIAGDAGSQPQLIASTRTEFSQAAPEEIAQQFARAVEVAGAVERHEDAVRRVRQRLMGDAAVAE